MPPKFFKGQRFALCGKLSQTHGQYEELIAKHGGELSTDVTGTTTFLLTNQDEVDLGSKKVEAAKSKSVPIVQEGFVGACVAAKKLLDPAKFALKDKKRKAAPKPKAGSTPKRAKVAAAGPVSTCDATVLPKSGLADKAAVLQEEITKGGFKATVTWDVELVLHDPAHATDKYYNMQLLASTAGDEFWVATHWGKTGSDGRCKVYGPFFDVRNAKKDFRKRYRGKTGTVFGQVGGTFEEVEGKYKLLVKGTKEDEIKDGVGKWQYYLHNKVDGKKIGWYDYQDKAGESMEKYWKQFQRNDTLKERIIRSDYFKYRVDFSELIQTNMTSGTRRVIRRIVEGEEVSEDPPEKIPEKVDAEADEDDKDDDDEEEEAEGEEDGEDEEEEGEAAEEAPAEEAAEEAAAEEEKAEEPAEEKAEPTSSGGRAKAKAPGRAAPKAGGRAAKAADEADTVPAEAPVLPTAAKKRG